MKTRLCPPLSFAEAAMVHHLSLLQTVTALSSLHPVIFYSGSREYFRDNFPETTLLPQSEGDLGERMAQALLTLQRRFGEGAILIGSDAPDLPLPLIREAFTALTEAEVVTIPARDGGYVLIGESGHHPPLFRGVPWSTAEVLSSTRAICAAQEYSYAEIGLWDDIDDADDLLRLIKRAPTLTVSSYAAEILRNYGLSG